MVKKSRKSIKSRKSRKSKKLYFKKGGAALTALIPVSLSGQIALAIALAIPITIISDLQQNGVNSDFFNSYKRIKEFIWKNKVEYSFKHQESIKYIQENDLKSLRTNLDISKINHVDHFRGMTLLHYAIKYNKERIVKFLLEHKEIDVNIHCSVDDNRKPFYKFFDAPNFTQHRNLLFREHVYKLPTKGNTALHFAAALGNIKIVQMLLDNGAFVDSLNESGKTPLHIAVITTQHEILLELLRVGAIINQECFFGLTPISYAIKSLSAEIIILEEHIKLINILLDSGETLDYKIGTNNQTLLLFFLNEIYTYQHRDSRYICNALEFLLGKGLDTYINIAVDDRKFTPLHFGSFIGIPGITDILLKNGANVNVGDDNGNTELHIATINQFPEIISILCNAGSDLEKTNNDGKTPLLLATEYAIVYGELKIVEKLLELGADSQNILDTFNFQQFNIMTENERLVKELLIGAAPRYNLAIHPPSYFAPTEVRGNPSIKPPPFERSPSQQGVYSWNHPDAIAIQMDNELKGIKFAANKIEKKKKRKRRKYKTKKTHKKRGF